jgi:hypothetical protein
MAKYMIGYTSDPIAGRTVQTAIFDTGSSGAGEIIFYLHCVYCCNMEYIGFVATRVTTIQHNSVSTQEIEY